MGKAAPRRADSRSVRARTPEAAAERRRQLAEATLVVELAWEAGVFDHLDDRRPLLRLETLGWMVLCSRVRAAAAELLQGQYPEVDVYATTCASYIPAGRPRFRVNTELRPWLRDGRLRPIRSKP